MSKSLRFLFFLFGGLFLCGQALHAQDIIYLKEEGRKLTVKVKEVDKKISYEKLSGSKEYSLPVKKVALLIYENGDILAFEDNESKLIPFSNPNFDILLNVYLERIPIVSHTLGETEVVFQTVKNPDQAQSLDRRDVLAIFHQNRSHTLFSEDVSQIAKSLYQLASQGVWVEEDTGNMVDGTRNPPPMSPLPDEKTVPDNPPPVNNPDTGPLPPIAGGSPGNNPSTPEEDTAPNPLFPDGDPEPTATDNSGNNKFGTQLPMSMEEFNDRANKKINQLYDYFGRLTNKNTRTEDVSNIIDLASMLFVSDTSVVEVSSLRRGVRRFKIRQYMLHLANIKYDQVVITNKEIAYVTDLKKGPDGNYYATITLLQEFQGFKDGRLIYRDLTEKRMEVVVKRFETFSQAGAEVFWDVLLSNIRVEQTFK